MNQMNRTNQAALEFTRAFIIMWGLVFYLSYFQLTQETAYAYSVNLSGGFGANCEVVT